MNLRPRPTPWRSLIAIALLATGSMSGAQPATPPAATPAAPAPASAPAPATTAAVVLSDLAWLSGCWRGNVNQREFREHWLPLRGNLLIGAGHTVTAFFEVVPAGTAVPGAGPAAPRPARRDGSPAR